MWRRPWFTVANGRILHNHIEHYSNRYHTQFLKYLHVVTLAFSMPAFENLALWPELVCSKQGLRWGFLKGANHFQLLVWHPLYCGKSCFPHSNGLFACICVFHFELQGTVMADANVMHEIIISMKVIHGNISTIRFCVPLRHFF